MSRARMAVLLGLLLLLGACGGRPASAAERPHGTPPAARISEARPARLAWKAEETFTAAVTFDEEDRGTVEDELRFTAHERFRVVRVQDGVATIRGTVTSWRWERNTSELLTSSPPAPFTFGADANAAITSGVDWPLPSNLPLPGLDVFAAPLTSGTGWSRTDGEGAGLSYHASGGQPPATTALDWSVVRPQFTASGEPVTVSGRAEAIVSSHYQRHGTTLTLRSTREQATFERTAQSAAGATRETGTILEASAFSSP